MDVVIVDWMRSPFHRAHKGELKDVTPHAKAVLVARALLSRNNILETHIEDILLGCAYPEGEQGYNVARLVGFLTGLPNTVPGSTFNRLCGSQWKLFTWLQLRFLLDGGIAFLLEEWNRCPE